MTTREPIVPSERSSGEPPDAAAEHPSQLAASESVERSYRLADGRSLRSTFLPDSGVFRLEATSPAPSIATEHTWRDPATGRSRVVRLDERGRIVGLLSTGTWGRLPDLIEAALEGTPIDAAGFDSFAATGALYFEAPAREATALSGVTDRIVCFCMQVPRRRLRKEIRAGCHSFEELRERTGCGSVCGGCEPLVRELLGSAQWSLVTAVAIPLRDDLRCFRLYPKGGARAPFFPGQHLIIEGFIAGKWIGRAYTITSPPAQSDYLELCIKREPHGLFSRWLFEGDLDEKALHISAPRGDLCWKPQGRPTVCFVAGIGVTPALAIARAALASRERHRLHLDYSAHSRSQLAFHDELSAAASDQFTLKLRATSADGRVTADEVRATARELPEADFYLCGPDSFMTLVREALVAAGIAAARIKVEVFVPAVSVAAAPPKEQAPPIVTVKKSLPPMGSWTLSSLVAMVLIALALYLAVRLLKP